MPPLRSISRAELEVLAQIGYSEGTIDEDEWQVVTNVIRLGEVTVGEVMTPRTDVKGIELTDDLTEIRQTIVDLGYSRIPVYEENLDHIIGILHVNLAVHQRPIERLGQFAEELVARAGPR